MVLGLPLVSVVVASSGCAAFHSMCAFTPLSGRGDTKFSGGRRTIAVSDVNPFRWARGLCSVFGLSQHTMVSRLGDGDGWGKVRHDPPAGILFFPPGGWEKNKGGWPLSGPGPQRVRKAFRSDGGGTMGKKPQGRTWTRSRDP